MHRATPVLSLALLALPQAALACGGFFCNRSEPVDQSKEAIVFAIDEDEGRIEMHVQVSYVGEADEFAWVVPTPTQPQPFLSTESLFTALEARTAPRLQLTTLTDGDCLTREHTGWESVDSDNAWDTADSGVVADSGGVNPGVLVVAREDVGPYATVTLQATDDAALLTWLQDEGYDLPDELGPALRPYLASGAYLLALKLRSGTSAGEIAPLGLTYAGRKPMIPITLTRIAATEDMRLVPYVLSSARAVPTNFLHVVPDEARLDWTRWWWDDRYEETVSEAADEAGGQAFATDFSGASAVMANAVVSPGAYDLGRLATRPTLVSFMEELLFRQGFTATDTLLSILREHVPMPQSLANRGVADLSFYNCPSCYADDYATIPYTPVPIVNALDERIVTPQRRAQDLFSAHRHLTRFTSSMSPAEMDLDPIFSINATLPDVSAVREATMTYLCDPEHTRAEVPRRLELADGREILMPPEVDWGAQTWAAFSRGFAPNAALRIEQLKEEGPPEPVTDNTPAAIDALDEHNAGLIDGLGLQPGVVGAPASEPVAACGCDGGAGGAWAGLGLLGLLGLRRRR